jgi:lipoprotein-anchoring transpeptidase ErfK/SrfK
LPAGGVLALLAALVIGVPVAASASPAHGQELAVLSQGQMARAQPASTAPALVWLAATRPLTEGRTVLPVLKHHISHGERWLEVRLPGRPNNRVGWIKQRLTRQSATAWQLVVDLSERRLTVLSHGSAVKVFSAVVGSPQTPTPRGHFFIEESILLPAQEVGAPYALALSARSYVLQEFAGGPGQIAVHGVAHVGGTMGTAASHGCVRLTTKAIVWLGERMGPGVPVTITA